MVAPIVTTLADDNPRTDNRMSTVTGYNQTICTIAFDQAIVKYSVNRGGTDHNTGTILESGDVSYSAGQSFTVTIDNTEILTGDNIINFYGMNANGEWSDGLVEAAANSYQYIFISGYGEDNAGTIANTTRMVEVEVYSGGVNRAYQKPCISGQAINFGVEIGSTTPTRVTDGVKLNTDYNGWWSDRSWNGNAGNGYIKMDLGQKYAIDKLRYWSYASANRRPRFKIFGTNSIDDYNGYGNTGVVGGATLLWDESLNSTKAVGTTIGTDNYIEKLL